MIKEARGLKGYTRYQGIVEKPSWRQHGIETFLRKASVRNANSICRGWRKGSGGKDAFVKDWVEAYGKENKADWGEGKMVTLYLQNSL